MMQQVTDAQIVDLYRRRWKPEQPCILHGETLWATVDGNTMHVGLMPGVAAPSAEVKEADAELAAFVAGLELPAPAEILTRGMRAFGRWVAAGLPIVTKETRAARGAECAVCPFWDGQARAGLGTCRHTACGCTSLKWWLATERCPAGKWPA